MAKGGCFLHPLTAFKILSHHTQMYVTAQQISTEGRDLEGGKLGGKGKFVSQKCAFHLRDNKQQRCRVFKPGNSFWA